MGLLKRQTPEQWRARGGSGGNPQILPQTTQDMDRLAASTQKFQMVGMQAAFAVDDFIAGFQTGGITGGLRGAANNISMIGMQLGGLKGLVIGVGVAAAASLVATLWKSWADGAESAAQSVSRVAKELDYLRETQKTVFEPQKRELSPEEHRFNADEMAPRANRDRQKDVEAELAQRQENQKALNQNAKRLENAKEKQDRELSNVFFGTTKDPFDKQGRMGSLEHQKDFLADNDSNPDRMKEWGVKDPEKMLERQKTLIDMTKDSEAASKAVVENEKQLNSLLEEQQALRVSMPVAVQREADAAAKEVQQEQESQQRKQDALERKVQAELRRDRRASDKKLTAQDQLDDLVTGENDPQAGILIEMKDRLDIAKQITDEARRLKAIEGIKESALNKLAKDELDGKPKESTERRLAGTYTRGSVDAYRVIQTAGAASRQTPDTKHLAAIQKLNAEQRDLLQSLVDKTAAEPLEVVGN